MLKKGTILLISSMIALTACSQGTNQSQEKEKGQKQEKVELRMAWWGGQARHDMFNKLLDAFEQKNPTITVAREFGTEGQFVEKVTAQAAGSSAPDVFQASSFYLDDFIGRKMYMELDPLIASGDINLKDYEKVDVDAGKKDNKQYLIPWGHIMTGIIYNADIFKKAGVELPKNNWTWDDYEKSLTALQKTLGDSAWATEDEGGSYRVLENFAIQKGKTVFTDKGLGITKQDLIDWYTIWDKLRKAKVIPPAGIQKEQGGKSQEQSMLAKGKVAMISTSSNQLRTYQSSTKDELNIVSYPWTTNAKQEVPMIVSGVGISVNSKHPKEAAKLINWLVNDPEAAKIFKGEHGQPPAKPMREIIKPLIGDAEKKEYKYSDDMQSVIKPYPAQPAGSASVQKLILAENEAIAFGKTSIEQAVNDFFAQANQILTR